MHHDPAYPPPSTWRFPPPPVGRRWKWIAVSASVLTTLGLGVAAAAFVVAETRDAPGVIDDTTVLDRIASACDDMTTTVESLPPGRSLQERAAVVDDQNRAIAVMVAEIESLGADRRADDRPLDAWLDDWRDLVEVRTDYARLIVRDGSVADHEIEVPLDEDGYPITFRMEDALLDDVCRVPEVLLDPDVASDLST